MWIFSFCCLIDASTTKCFCGRGWWVVGVGSAKKSFSPHRSLVCPGRKTEVDGRKGRTKLASSCTCILLHHLHSSIQPHTSKTITIPFYSRSNLFLSAEKSTACPFRDDGRIRPRHAQCLENCCSRATADQSDTEVSVLCRSKLQLSCPETDIKRYWTEE